MLWNVCMTIRHESYRHSPRVPPWSFFSNFFFLNAHQWFTIHDPRAQKIFYRSQLKRFSRADNLSLSTQNIFSHSLTKKKPLNDGRSDSNLESAKMQQTMLPARPRQHSINEHTSSQGAPIHCAEQHAPRFFNVNQSLRQHPVATTSKFRRRYGNTTWERISFLHHLASFFFASFNTIMIHPPRTISFSMIANSFKLVTGIGHLDFLSPGTVTYRFFASLGAQESNQKP